MPSHMVMAALALLGALLAPVPAWAYIGPGAGLGMIGSLAAVIGLVLLAIAGLIFLPLRMLAKRRRTAAARKSADTVGEAQHR